LFIGLALAGCPTAEEPLDDDDDDTAGDDDDTVDDSRAAEMQAARDEFWGEAPDVDTRLEVFDTLWEELAEGYGAFVTSDVDWDAVYDDKRPLIEEAESQGHYVQILASLFDDLQDGHSYMRSAAVCSTPLTERPPVFWQTHYDSVIGACATPLDDGSLLVYRVLPDNPAGVAPGDRILGYDGRDWADLLQEIQTWEIPSCASHAATDEGQRLLRLATAVNNPHLFSALDVQLASDDSVVAIDTEDLLSYAPRILCNDQIGEPSIGLPWESWDDYDGNGTDDVVWGTLPGSNIGYIASYSWIGDTRADLLTAVQDLMDTDGLIVDFRFNVGGSSTNSLPSMALLFDEDQLGVYNAYLRESTDDYHAMTPYAPGAYDIIADSSTFYGGPIALLSGPHAISAGDGVTHLLSLHPNTRRFGRTSNGSYGFGGGYWDPDPITGDLTVNYTPGILSGPDGEWLHAAEQDLDDPVWLDPDDVAAGVDTVIEAARSWIEVTPAPR